MYLPGHIHTSQYDIESLRISDVMNALPEIELVLGVQRLGSGGRPSGRKTGHTGGHTRRLRLRTVVVARMGVYWPFLGVASG